MADNVLAGRQSLLKGELALHSSELGKRIWASPGSPLTYFTSSHGADILLFWGWISALGADILPLAESPETFHMTNNVTYRLLSLYL